jgi:hypothetical protein
MALTEDQVAAWQEANPTATMDELIAAAQNGLQPLVRTEPEPTQPAPNTVEKMYQTVLGREGETEGVDYWKSVFGNEVDPNELATFKQAAQAELANRSPAEQAKLAPNAYFQANPDVAESYKQNNYGMTPAEFATAHYNKYGSDEGRVSTLQDNVDKWFTEHPNATPQQIVEAINATGGLTPEYAQAIANTRGTTADAVQAAYTALVPQKSFQEQIQQYNPDSYNQIKNLAQYTANENFGGQVQDYQIQLFTPLNTNKTGIPKQLEFTPVETKTAYNEDGNQYEYQQGGYPKTKGVEQNEDGTFSSTTPTYVNGVPVFATYNENGKITGYQGDPRVVTWLDGGHYAYGNWDAQGNANPKQVATRGGGFIGGLASGISDITKSLGPLWTAAKLYNPALNFVDVGTNVAQGNFGGKTALSAASGAGQPVAKGGSIGGLNSMLKRTKLRGM